MNFGYYSKFAIDGIKKNRRLYLPYIFTFIGMIMMFYIIDFMAYNEILSDMKGGGTLEIILGLGKYVIAIFAAIFLFYTNSFLIKRRKKEFGLYSILGMSRKNIGKIVFWETIIVAAVSLFSGLILGIAFSKLAELGLLKLLEQQANFTFTISSYAIIETIILFCAVSLLLLLNSFRQIKFKSTISLLRSDNYGEKPPKANWLFGLLGIVLLGVAYYLAITIKQPIAAISFFFIAVILVILGTYLLMISGSVLLCKILQKKKSYYYKTNHFISVSSMAYRMKRNGAGLATICILATMVLVMISSTASLYIGAEESINNSYPRDFAFSAIPGNLEQIDDETYNRLIDSIENKLEDAEIEHFNEFSYRTASLSGEIIDDRVNYVPDTVVNLENVCTFFIVPLSDYNRIMDSHETVPRGQAMMLCEGMSYSKDSIAFGNCKEIKIAKEMDEFISLVNSSSPITSRMILVINDEDMESVVQPILDEAPYDMTAITMYMQYYCDINDDDLVRLDSISSTLSTDLYSNFGIDGSNLGIKEYSKDDFYGTFGGLFYLGIILSIVFIVAAVLIIYYKQISEGYEDQSRFDIMQKVGITKKEIRRTINSQLLTIFFLPLVLAGVHMACAFPMITKMLNLFYLYDVKLFLLITLLSFVVFGIAYGVVYKMTSKAYYKIVSGGQN